LRRFAGSGRRPRACLASTLPGGAGAPPGGTTTPREELADGGSPYSAIRGQSAARRRKENAGRRAERRHAPATAREL